MMEWLNRPLGPFPLWIWLAVIGGGLLVAFVIVPKLRGNSSGSSGSLGSGQTSTTAPDPNLDPNTGIPYAVETATNPATGLPNYNQLVGLQSTTQGIAASQSNPSNVASSVSPFLSNTDYYTVGSNNQAGNTLNSISSFFHLKYGANDLYGNPANSQIAAMYPYNGASAFTQALPAGTQVYVPPDRIGS